MRRINLRELAFLAGTQELYFEAKKTKDKKWKLVVTSQGSDAYVLVAMNSKTERRFSSLDTLQQTLETFFKEQIKKPAPEIKIKS